MHNKIFVINTKTYINIILIRYFLSAIKLIRYTNLPTKFNRNQCTFYKYINRPFKIENVTICKDYTSM